jgi:uncharacterized protein (DUF1697 family)
LGVPVLGSVHEVSRSPQAGAPAVAALLRGINLRRHNRIAMADLRKLVDELGGEDVQTYVQSGNVVFRSRAAASKLEEALTRRIRDALGLDVTVLVRTAAGLAKVVSGNPFLATGADPTMLHATFLATTPARGRVRRLNDADFAPDELRVSGRTVYVHCPAGYGRSKLSNAFLEKELDVRATTRNWRTVTALAELTRTG